MAGVIYDTAARAARIAQAKDAHDTVVAAAHRAQADALSVSLMPKFGTGKADVRFCGDYVRFTPNSGHSRQAR